ncbi:MAG: class I SAM-dependent methyltransferase [Proteobacteria bacterium]|nr:class I SAM-dependent methyltransferase [Pseudomonadota bacterium]NOG59064.1 class I SAM-dependent methyltransferase [Pseudomonadota bacterium]
MSFSFRNKKQYDKIYSFAEYDISSVYDHVIRIRQRYLKNDSGFLLDHGYGNAVVSEYFQKEKFDVYGTETSEATKRFVFQRTVTTPNLKPEQFVITEAGINELPFSDGYFSVVISNQVLFFLGSLQDINKTVDEFYRVLTPGGKLVCTVMAENNYLFTNYGLPPVPENGIVNVRMSGRLSRNWYLYRFRDEEDVKNTFIKSGFVIDDLGYFDYKLLDATCAKHYIVLAHKPH